MHETYGRYLIQEQFDIHTQYFNKSVILLEKDILAMSCDFGSKKWQMSKGSENITI